MYAGELDEGEAENTRNIALIFVGPFLFGAIDLPANRASMWQWEWKGKDGCGRYGKGMSDQRKGYQPSVPGGLETCDTVAKCGHQRSAVHGGNEKEFDSKT